MRWRVLGPVEAVVHGEPLPLGRPQQRAVLAYLLLNANVAVSAEQLAEALWGGAMPTSARTQVQVFVYRLRRLIRAAGLPDMIFSDSAGYRLELPADDLDALVFSALTADARGLAGAGAHERATVLLRQALALWRGPALDGASAAFVPVAAASLHERRLAAYEDLFDAEFALGRHAAAVAPLHRLVAENPWRETLAAQLMTALAGSGRRAEALTVFERLRRRLADELGVEPGARLAECHALLSRHRSAPGRPAEVVRDGASRPAQLPADLSTFTGRDDALTTLDSMLGTAAVVAIVGTAGVGKTALAVRWAHRVKQMFDGGQLFLDLGGYSPGAPLATLDALSRCLRALGVPPPQVPDDVLEATTLYRNLLAGRRMLILLDNARDVAQIEPLLPHAGGCLVIVTSRDRLDGPPLHDAHHLSLEVLAPGEAAALLTRVIGADRVAGQRTAVADLAQVCARLPLALRIAAADLLSRPHETVAGYLARLRVGDPLTTLAIREDEQTAVRSAFAVSYQALSPRLQRLFRMFGIVPGTDLSADSAAAMMRCATGEAAGLLSNLAGAHLVQERAPGRFATHDLLGLYAAELAQAEGNAETLTDLLSWYLFSAHAAADRLCPHVLRVPLQLPAPASPPMRFETHVDALAWLDAQRHNLVAAIRHAARQELHAFAWSLADALRGYLWLGMHTTEWSQVAPIGLAAARTDRHEQAEAASRLSLAVLNWRLERFPEAIDDYQLALEHANRAGWRDGQATALGNLGPVYRMTGWPREALRVMQQALQLSRSGSRTAGIAVNHNNLGLVCADLGLLGEAAEHHHAALALARQGNAVSSRALILGNLGAVYHLLGRLDEAVETLTEALGLHEQTGSRGRATTTCSLARVHHDRGDRPQATELARQTLGMARDPAEPRLEAMALHILGLVDGDAGILLDALSHARTSADRYIEADIIVSLAELDEPAALSWCRAALAIAGQCGYRVLEGRAYAARAAAEHRAGDLTASWHSAQLAAQLFAQTGHRPGMRLLDRLA